MADKLLKVTQPDDREEKYIRLKDNGDGSHSFGVSLLNGLVPEVYDYVALSYTGSDLTGVVYKTGGSGGTTVATLTLGYSGGNLVSIAST